MATSNPSDLADGDVVTETWVDAVTQHVVRGYASDAARDAELTDPHTGQLVAMTTNGATEGLSQQNSNGDWGLPWNIPRGVVGYASTTSSSSGTTSTTDWSGLSVSWTAKANRLYMTIASGSVGSTSAGEVVSLLIADGSSTQKQSDAGYIASASYGTGLTPVIYETGLSGSVTRKVRVNRVTSLGTVTGAATSTAHAQIVVFDLGPIGAPD